MAILLSHFDHLGLTYIVRDSELPVILGGSRTSNICFDDGFLSPLHCIIDRSAEDWIVRDLATRSGTYVNGDRVAEATLTTGDRLTLGKTTLRVYIDGPHTAKQS